MISQRMEILVRIMIMEMVRKVRMDQAGTILLEMEMTPLVVSRHY